MGEKENIEVIKAHYDEAPELEWNRTNEGTIEYIITIQMLDRYIKSGDKVLDIGGGREDILPGWQEKAVM